MHRNQLNALCLLMALSGAFATQTLAAPRPAHNWKVISAAKEGERIELDTARIGRMPNGNTAAWSRLSLGFDIPDVATGVRYSVIEALNSYDCSKREYSTLKRIYVGLDGKPVREEKVAAPRNIAINEGSFEEKLLPHVCKPRSVGEMQGIADLVSQFATPPASTTPPAREDRQPKAAEITTVSDTGTAPTPIGPATKPRMIELPKIDKSKVEDPYAGQPPPAKKPAEAKPAEPKSAEPKPAITPATPAKTAESPSYHTGNVSRAEIERQLATFGQRKVRTPKPAAAKPIEEAHAPHIHWAYEGKGGPENWARINPANTTCAEGKRQSPIDIRDRDGIKVDLEPITFNYGQTGFSVIDNGHTVQVNIAEGQSIRIMERTYQLLQFHFHKPSEERVNGRSYDMVAHFVHKDYDGKLAVVAVLMEKGPEHPVLQTLWNNLPLEQGTLVSPSVQIDLSKLLPTNRAYWTYMGSLTTPPCSEGVLWMVLQQPLQISAEQLSIFGRLYPNNARPVQPTHNRLIKGSR